MARVIAVGDIQFPFQHPDMFIFLKAVVKKYKPNTMVQIGDLADQYFANAWGKSTKAKAAKEEFEQFIEDLHFKFLPIFKGMKKTIIIGNHDERIFKRADEAGIPDFVLKSMKDLYQLPKDIPLVYDTVIDGVTYTHGHTSKCTSATADSILTTEYETPVVYGHFHSAAGINFLANRRRLVWGFNLGCLIDRNTYAFQYGASYNNKPILGVGIIIDGHPQFIPMMLDKNHRWTGKLIGGNK